jgi:hypothetical protein
LYDFLIGVCGVVLGNNGLPCVDDGVDPNFKVGFFGIFGILIPLFNDIFFFDLFCFVIYFMDIKYITNFFYI